MSISEKDLFDARTAWGNGLIEISETFENLLRVFGTPMGTSDDGKVDVEWNVMFNDGVVATIYNWKNGPASMGENGTNPVDIETWHIGGKTISAVYDVEEILKSF